jgi:hypothetical protein
LFLKFRTSSGTEFLYLLPINHCTAFDRHNPRVCITSRTRRMCSGLTVTISSTAFSASGFVGRPRFLGDGFMVFYIMFLFWECQAGFSCTVSINDLISPAR